MSAATADQLFDVEEHPKAGVIRQLQDALADLLAKHESYGGLLTQAQVALLTGLSRERINQLVKEGAFRRVEVRAHDGEVIGTFVAVGDVLSWLKSNPIAGTPGRISKAKFLWAAADIDR